MIRAAEAPRAASSISRSSTRWSWTGRAQRLNEEDILLAAIRLQLHLDAVVREPLQPRRQQRNIKLRTNLFSQCRMSTTTEDGDRTQRVSSSRDLATLRGAYGRPGTVEQRPGAMRTRARREAEAGRTAPVRLWVEPSPAGTPPKDASALRHARPRPHASHRRPDRRPDPGRHGRRRDQGRAACTASISARISAAPGCRR